MSTHYDQPDDTYSPALDAEIREHTLPDPDGVEVRIEGDAQSACATCEGEGDVWYDEDGDCYLGPCPTCHGEGSV